MKSTHSLFAALLGILLSTPCLFSQTPVAANYDNDNHIWTLSNGLIQAQWRLTAQNLFQLWALRHPAGKRWLDRTLPLSSPINLSVDGKLLNDSTQWELEDTYVESVGRGGSRHVISLHNEQTSTGITLRLEMYPGQPFLRTYYSYRNLDQGTHYVQRARIFNLRLATEMRPMQAFYVNQVRRGTPLMFDIFEKNFSSVGARAVTVSAGAYADQCTWLALRDDANNGIVFGWEFDGRSSVTAQLTNAGNQVVVSGGPQNLNIPVLFGREINFPAGFVGLFEGDWDEAGYRTQRYAEEVLAAPLPDDNFPYLMYNSWGYDRNIDEATLRRTAQIASQIGVEVFVVDLGWSRQIGDWVQDTVKFPGGLRGFSDYVHSLGMKFGLHFVPSEAVSSAPVLAANPDWTSSVNDSYFEAESMCLANGPAQAWIRANILRVIGDYGADWIAQDGENLVKDCSKSSHTHDPLNSNWSNSVNGIDALVDYARARAPQTLWENNADGGTMSTFNAVKRYATFGSCDACDELPRRQAIYGMSYVFPPRFISRYMGEYPTKFTTRSSMFGGPWILMQRLTEFSSEDINLLRQEGALYKSLRGLIREGKVFHLLGRPDGFSIEAMESFRPDWDRGVVFVYRPESPVSVQRIFPKGLNPTRNYRVSFQENSTTFLQSGASLMSEGISVRLPTPNFAEIVYLTGQ